MKIQYKLSICGKYIDINLLNNDVKILNFLKTRRCHEDGINIKFSEFNDLITINQTKLGSRVYFINEVLRIFQ